MYLVCQEGNFAKRYQLFHALTPTIGCQSLCRPTVSVSCGGWEGGLAVETGKTRSQKNAQKRGAYPPVGCTLCQVVSAR